MHALTLLPDPWLKPNLAEIVVPFTGGYRPFYTGLGIIAAWGAAILGLSYYFRRRIGPARWRSLHRLTIVVWALGVIHTLGAGTDGGQRWMVILVAATTAPILFLFVRRMLPETPGTAPATGEQPRRATPSAAAAAPVRTARSRTPTPVRVSSRTSRAASRKAPTRRRERSAPRRPRWPDRGRR